MLKLSILAAKQEMNFAITTCKGLVGENEKSGYCHYNQYLNCVINKELHINYI